MCASFVIVIIFFYVFFVGVIRLFKCFVIGDQTHGHP